MPTIAGTGRVERQPAASVFGRYELGEVLGAGGMGLVYRAYDPMLERHVALKIVRAVGGDEENQRRLFREAQVLAQLRHPNVVAVHDVGTLGTDVFVAMELVEGTPLSRWQKERGVREILGAYLQAGRGLAAAHDRGLVHRDVKPGNILVGDDGRVTVIDFGLAAVEGEAPTPVPLAPTSPASVPAEYNSYSSLRTPLTEAGKVMGTPRYMSPEQHAGDERVDAHSDQYSFAVALYEALARAWPFVRDESVRDKGLQLRYAKERGELATPDRAVPSHLRRALQRALALRPSARFATMAALLEKLERDPARTRRRALASVAVVASLAFGAWSAVAGPGNRSAAKCRGADAELTQTWNPTRRAAVERAFLATDIPYAGDTAARVAASLDRYGRDWTRMRTDACEATHSRGVQSERVLDLRMRCLDRQRASLDALLAALADAPDRQVVDRAIEASLELGGLDQCADIEGLERQVAAPERAEDREELAALRRGLDTARQLHRLGKYADAKERLEALAPRVDALAYPPLQAEFAYQDALTLKNLGRYAEAEPAMRTALELALQWNMVRLAAEAGVEAATIVGYSQQRHEEGMVYAFHTRALSRGRGDALEASALATLATLHSAQGDFARAQALDERALALRQKVLGPDHPDVATSLNSLAGDFYAQGQYAKAESFFRDNLAIWERNVGPDHPKVATLLNNLAVVTFALGNFDEAEQLHQRAIAIRESSLGPNHPDVAYSLNNLADLYRERGKLTEAVALHQRALEIRETVHGPEHPDVAVSVHNLGACYADQGEYDQAESHYERALTLFETTLGAEHAYVAYPLIGLAEVYEQQRGGARALALFERAYRLRERAEAPPAERAEAAFGVARALHSAGKDRPRARALAEAALETYRTLGPDADEERRAVSEWLAAQR